MSPVLLALVLIVSTLFAALVSGLFAMAGNALAAKPLEKLSNDQFRLWGGRILLILGAVFLFQGIQLWLAG